MVLGMCTTDNLINFICSLFYNGVSTSHYTASNGKVIADNKLERICRLSDYDLSVVLHWHLPEGIEKTKLIMNKSHAPIFGSILLGSVIFMKIWHFKIRNLSTIL
jgi:hypothetical protein